MFANCIIEQHIANYFIFTTLKYLFEFSPMLMHGSYACTKFKDVF